MVGLKVQQASLKAGLGQTTLRDFMVGRAQTITLRTLSKLAPILDTTAEYLHAGASVESGRVSEIDDILDHLAPESQELVLNLARGLYKQQKGD